MTQKKFGYETVGVFDYWMSANWMHGCLFTSPADAGGASANSITFYCAEDYGGTINVKVILVLHSTMKIVANGVGSPVTVSGASGAWYTGTFATPPILAANTGYVLMIIPNAGSSNLRWFYNAGDANQHHKDDTNSYTTPQNPTGPVHNAFKQSIYCTYTLAGPPTGWRKLQYLTEPPTAGTFNKLRCASEPPVVGAWNKLLYSDE
jgi:hypothetical protein